MAVLPIRVVPDPVLRQKAKRVKAIDKSIRKLVNDMQETLHAASGVGLAANQVGISLRLIVLNVPENECKVIINPEIIRRTGERIVNEGCLSIPGYVGEIKRSELVRIKGQDSKGKEIRIKAEGLLAEVLEHEIDHINGVLYVDHLESQDKLHKIEPPQDTSPQAE
ncbi:MAG: peptide deformylase [Chloroflexi bacterium]|nr:peptide deformylase [Chloroflexota bacterium]